MKSFLMIALLLCLVESTALGSSRRRRESSAVVTLGANQNACNGQPGGMADGVGPGIDGNPPGGPFPRGDLGWPRACEGAQKSTVS